MDDLAERLERVHTVGGCLARSLLAAGAGLYLLVGLIAAQKDLAGLGGTVVAGIVAAAALGRESRVDRWAMAAAGASICLTLVLMVAGEGSLHPSAMLEGLALLVLITRVTWRSPRNRVVLLAVTLGVAVVVTPARFYPVMGLLIFGVAPLAVVVAVAVGVGLYLRALDSRRDRALSDARQDERLELARDLHDFVAHHVTGIVVQAQAARFVAGTEKEHDPERLDALFADIERAGTEALTSMRRMIGLLRDPAENGATTMPVGDLGAIAELVGGFAHPPATLQVAYDVGALPPEVVTSVYRIVQEALTNARKHAADATGVLVTVRRPVPGAVEVAVRDDGRGRGRLLPGGGYGLAGLRERVDVLGGTLRAGPRPEGGWEVVAVLPITDSTRTISP